VATKSLSENENCTCLISLKSLCKMITEYGTAFSFEVKMFAFPNMGSADECSRPNRFYYCAVADWNSGNMSAF
jgi:hypothetical protein